MASLSEDLRLLALIAYEKNLLTAAPSKADLAADGELSKIDWKRMICFSIPIANIFLPMYGMPPVPVPPFCSTPVPPTPGPVG
jgi:hypothetical protein